MSNHQSQGHHVQAGQSPLQRGREEHPRAQHAWKSGLYPGLMSDLTHLCLQELQGELSEQVGELKGSMKYKKILMWLS